MKREIGDDGCLDTYELIKGENCVIKIATDNFRH